MAIPCFCNCHTNLTAIGPDIICEDCNHYPGTLINPGYTPPTGIQKVDDFTKLLDEIRSIHDLKKQDYSDPNDRFSNFTYSDYLARPFPDSHKSFAVLVGTKLARIAVLLTSSASPNNESLDDSFKDLATYCVIWWHYYRNSNK